MSPCNDFFQYSCGGFVKNNFIRDDQANLNRFVRAQDHVDYNQKELLEKQQLSSYSKVSGCVECIYCCKVNRLVLLNVVQRYAMLNRLVDLVKVDVIIELANKSRLVHTCVQLVWLCFITSLVQRCYFFALDGSSCNTHNYQYRSVNEASTLVV